MSTPSAPPRPLAVQRSLAAVLFLLLGGAAFWMVLLSQPTFFGVVGLVSCRCCFFSHEATSQASACRWLRWLVSGSSRSAAVFCGMPLNVEWPETPRVKIRTLAKQDDQCNREAVNTESKVRSAASGSVSDSDVQPTLTAKGWLSPLMGVEFGSFHESQFGSSTRRWTCATTSSDRTRI